MTWLRALWALSLVACVDGAGAGTDDDVDLAGVDTIATDNTDATWQLAPTLHGDARLYDAADAGSRRVHSLWVSGSNNNRVPLSLAALADGDHDVRIAVLGPLVDGTRAVLAADGYSTRKRAVSVSVDIAATGEHLVVLGSFDLATNTSYELSAACTGPGCGVSRVDALATPKDGALTGDADGLVQMQLGDVLVGYGDVEVDIWASPPMRPAHAHQITTSYASGSQVNAILPSSVQQGDDLRLVVREPEGRVLDTGVLTRFAPAQQAFARTDGVIYGDNASVAVAGVVGFFEGVADLRLRSETRDVELAQQVLHADRPGHVGNGLNAFDATFRPAASLAAAEGELLSIGFINGNGDYRRLGCFEYCSASTACTGGARHCPL